MQLMGLQQILTIILVVSTINRSQAQPKPSRPPMEIGADGSTLVMDQPKQSRPPKEVSLEPLHIEPKPRHALPDSNADSPANENTLLVDMPYAINNMPALESLKLPSNALVNLVLVETGCDEWCFRVMPNVGEGLCEGGCVEIASRSITLSEPPEERGHLPPLQSYLPHSPIIALINQPTMKDEQLQFMLSLDRVTRIDLYDEVCPGPLLEVSMFCEATSCSVTGKDARIHPCSASTYTHHFRLAVPPWVLPAPPPSLR